MVGGGCYIGVEIGASKVQAALGYADGKLISVSKHSVVLENGAEGILAWLEKEIPLLAEKSRAEYGGVTAIGIGFGGILETSSGVSVVSVQVEGWKDFPVKTWFEKTFGFPVLVLNDTVAGGCGEYFKRYGENNPAAPKVFFYTNIGSGIGGCILINGRIFDGSGYGGAYFGHTYIPDCNSAVRGAYTKVETMCSGFGIEKRLGMRCIELEDKARAGDKAALAEIERIADSYALGLSNVITLFGVQEVVIGGGVAKFGDILFDPIRRQTEKYVFISAAARYRIEQSLLMDDAVLSGAINAAAGLVKEME
jgi:glucokinase